MHTVYQVALSATLIIELLLGGVLFPRAATAATYYVDTTGNDANPGTQAKPFRTIRQGLSMLQANDTLYLRGGTYTENISSNKQTIPAGTSWSNAVTIAAYEGETVTLQPSGVGDVLTLAASYMQYIIFDSLVIDARGAENGIAILNGAHHIRIQNGEVKNARANGIFTASASSTSHNEFLNLKVHDNGSSRLDHGFYIQTSYSLIDGCDIYNNSGYGIHVYNGYGTGKLTDNTIIRNNQVHDNRGDGGVTLNHGDNIEFHDNFVYNQRSGVEVSYGNPTNTQISNNTIYNHWGAGITVSRSCKETVIEDNTLYQNAVAIDDRGSETTLRDNDITKR
jgi:parallel beta-helix repeat protein